MKLLIIAGFLGSGKTTLLLEAWFQELESARFRKKGKIPYNRRHR